MKLSPKGLGKRLGLHIIIPVVYALALLAIFIFNKN
ncbi:hypothetical protein Niako_6179 [Niastella koreensis GR20-10]|uniref:Uncharacterized protein n=1 Tax=Niastella koreensis (strain DSM 17620 / KACC 11465 / NBRC 106392 / GR20-10) TaxID=700598 RepID=G8TA32_NIAKG|nr:hypothetical protein Niako_6179 [Niastella koreensis GR20-10]